MADVNVKMGVSGVAQFKSAMTQSKSAVKALDAELKLNAAQYKQSGNQEEYLRKRTELLNKQIQEQENVTKAAQQALNKMAEQGVDKASTAYQKMQEQVAKAQTELVQMRTALTEGTGEMKDTASAADKLADKLSSIDKKVTFNAVLQGLKAVKDVATSVASSISNALKSAWSGMSEAANWADDLATMAEMYGVTTKELQAMQYAQNFVDVSAETILKAGYKIATKKKENGVTLLDANHGATLTGSITEQFWQVMEIINEIDDAATQATLAQDIFGKSWLELKPVFDDKAKWYEKMAEAEENGYVLQDENVDSLNELKDAQDELDAAWKSFLLNMSSDFAPMFEEFCNKLIELLRVLQEQMKTEEWQALVQRIMDMFLGIVNILTNPETINNVLDKLMSVISFMAKILGIDLDDKPNNGDAGDNPGGNSGDTPGGNSGGNSSGSKTGYISWSERRYRRLKKEYGKDAPMVLNDNNRWVVDPEWLDSEDRMLGQVTNGKGEVVNVDAQNVLIASGQVSPDQLETDLAREAGEALAEEELAGVKAKAQAAFEAGESLGAIIVAGTVVGAHGAGREGLPSTSYTTNQNFVDTININGGNTADIYETVRIQSEQNRSGVGS